MTRFFVYMVAASLTLPVAAQRGDPHLARARAILREVPLVDGHNDLPWELRSNWALTFDSLDIRRTTPNHTDIARLRSGMVGAQFWSTYTPSSFGPGHIAARGAMEQNDVVYRLVERYPDVFEIALTAEDVWRIFRAGKIASMLGLEGGHMIENSLGALRAFYRDGVRYMTLTHSRNTDWADASTDTLAHGGLTRFGDEVVREMNRLGMLVDISHVADSTMWDVLRVSEAPVIFSHSSSRHFAPHPRNVPDDVARALAQNDGVIMVTFVPGFIHGPTYEWGQRQDSIRRASGDAAAQGWAQANPTPMPDLGVIADHLEHLRDVAGVDHVGIGGDFDGIGSVPVGLEDVSTYPALVAELLRRGWSDGDVKKVVGLNALRVMAEAERVAARLQRERAPSTAQIEILDGWETSPPWRVPSSRP
ncbi:MAG: dipeptidase [Gemmatimonadales bacterium]